MIMSGSVDGATTLENGPPLASTLRPAGVPSRNAMSGDSTVMISPRTGAGIIAHAAARSAASPT
jgi:hypothetical protein